MALTQILVQGQDRVTEPAQTAVSDTAGIVSYPKQRMLFRAQNAGTTIMYLNLSSTLPTATVYQVALAACTVANNGTGGVFEIEGWAGPVSALSSAAGGFLVLTEVLTPPSWV